ncbi:hypothetical protein DPM19_33630 [Actinomadura craniellae]|uniref:Uncharacterized protein n=1 Tax=Actinomadura craniellae TaxID=2231787 RepID=A0A365GVB9_9ACTN|nr:hypothetical protein DPM19_33630 [Actinomadura craniellae]
MSFVRNIGEPRDMKLGGGTYGFGKGIFYLVSDPGTILVHTRCRTAHGLETRLIGCALWKKYVAKNPEGERGFTGRHWWGVTTGEVVEPLIGAEADAMARRLGLAPFKADETGTSVVMIDPVLEDREPIDAATYLAETIMWHLWPKMLGDPTESPAMTFSVTCDGRNVPVPDPRETRPLNLFVDAYQALKGQEGKDLRCGNPKQFLGRLGLKKTVAPVFEPTDAGRMVGIETTAHHVCLMRPAELVVTYHQGPKPPAELLSYAGVFRADEAMDGVYAKAEPPTHDAWNPHSLQYPESTFVRTTFTRINEALTDLLDLGGGARAGSARVPLGAASNRFSPLMGGAWGIGGATDYRTAGTSGSTGTSPSSSDERSRSKPTNVGAPAPSAGGKSAGAGTGSGATKQRRLRVDYVGDAYLDERAGHAVIVQPFRLPVPGLQRVSAELAVALKGASETEPPVGAEMPGLVGWEDASGGLSATASYVIEGGDGAIWHAIIRPAPDTVTDVTVATQAVQAP